MNKISGYKTITLADGSEIGLSFGMGCFEIFGSVLGLRTVSEAMSRLQPKPEDNGEITFELLAAFRVLLFSAAKLACLLENRPVTFNEYTPHKWMQEVGMETISQIISEGMSEEYGGETAEPKKKAKAQLIKATA